MSTHANRNAKHASHNAKKESAGCLRIFLILGAVVGVSILVIVYAPSISLPEPGTIFRTGDGIRIESEHKTRAQPQQDSSGTSDGTTGETTEEISEETSDTTGETSGTADATDGAETTAATGAGTADTATGAATPFAERTRADYEGMLTAHDRFTAAVEAFGSDGDGAALRAVCEETQVYFTEADARLQYGTSDGEREFMYLFLAAAMSDRIAASAIIKYLDSGDTSSLSDPSSDANRNIKDAGDAYAAIAARQAE